MIDPPSNFKKYFALILCIIQNTALVIMIRYSKTREGDRYLTSTAVAVAEAVKVITSFLVIAFQQWRVSVNVSEWMKNVKTYCAPLMSDSVKVAVPAGIYAVQNNLLYFALSNLDPAPYQVSNQGKIFTTAILSVFMLGRSLTGRKWLGITFLFVGICLVQLESLNNGSTPMPHEQNVVQGAAAVIIACFTSAFAGVYFEKILKGSNVTLWIRNIQLGTYGFIFSMIMAYMNDYSVIMEKGFFFAYNSNVIIVILLQAIGGLIIAVVIAYTDNIIKGFAASTSIILSSLVSVWLFNYHLSLLFLLGTTFVLLSVYLYIDPPKSKSTDEEV